MTWNSLAVQWLGLSTSTVGGRGYGFGPSSILETKIPLATWQDQKELNLEKKNTQN